MFKGKNGMTLIELMIVVAIIGLLAAVAIPKYGDLLEKANLGATIGNLASLRSCVSIYNANYMALPGTIDPRVQPLMDKVINGEMPAVKVKEPKANPPAGNMVTVGVVDTDIPTGPNTGWFYNKVNGSVYINSTANDIKGQPYTSY